MRKELSETLNKVRAGADRMEQRRKDNWEAVNKAVYTLIVGHAAGLVACMTLLKDYNATSPGHLTSALKSLWAILGRPAQLI
jgi:hypothetical protein